MAAGFQQFLHQQLCDLRQDYYTEIISNEFAISFPSVSSEIGQDFDADAATADQKNSDKSSNRDTIRYDSVRT